MLPLLSSTVMVPPSTSIRILCFALVTIARTLAVEGAEHGITANVLNPLAATAEMPDSVAPHVSTINEDELVSYYRADMITEEMAHALEMICAEETRYLVRLPVISPAVPGASASGQ